MDFTYDHRYEVIAHGWDAIVRSVSSVLTSYTDCPNQPD